MYNHISVECQINEQRTSNGSITIHACLFIFFSLISSIVGAELQVHRFWQFRFELFLFLFFARAGAHLMNLGFKTSGYRVRVLLWFWGLIMDFPLPASEEMNIKTSNETTQLIFTSYRPSINWMLAARRTLDFWTPGHSHGLMANQCNHMAKLPIFINATYGHHVHLSFILSPIYLFSPLFQRYLISSSLLID